MTLKQYALNLNDVVYILFWLHIETKDSEQKNIQTIINLYKELKNQYLASFIWKYKV